ncbi:MAG: hypothetical protein WA821_11665 [Anaerolineales bacterium]
MYVFVRFTGVVLVVFGALLMLAGFGGALYLLIQKDTLVAMLNAYLLAGGGRVVVTGDFLSSLALYALAFFLTGMFTAAFGQLMLVFADIGSNSRETNILLRSLRNKGL